jgi:hypothetical protein
MLAKSKVTLCLLLMVFFCVSAEAQESSLYTFYTESSPNYPWAFGNDRNCDPVVGMSSRTKNFKSPSKLAVRGLEAAFANDLASAVACEEKLREFEKESEGGLFYAFKDDYIDAWPFHLKAPWVSAFTQGVALEFYMEMAKKTGKTYYKDKAEKIYLAYFVPVDKGGFTRFVGKTVIFEEYPVSERIAVLNGNLIATIALYDYADFSRKSKARQLARRSVSWLENNIQSYVITRPEYSGPISAYSLAPSRLDLLFRFYLTKESVDVFSIVLAGQGISRSIRLGDAADHDTTREASLIVSPDMNWSVPYNDSKQKDGGYRKVVQDSGSFNHAPFRMEIKSSEELNSLKKGISLELVYRAQGSTDVQVSDGKTFYKISTLAPTNGKIETVRFDIPQAALSNLTFPTALKYNALYFSHNQKLLGIVAEVSASKVLKQYSELLSR